MWPVITHLFCYLKLVNCLLLFECMVFSVDVPMAGDQRISVVVQCVEVASDAISGKEEAKQAEQWEVGYIFPATELLSLVPPLEYIPEKSTSLQ